MEGRLVSHFAAPSLAPDAQFFTARRRTKRVSLIFIVFAARFAKSDLQGAMSAFNIYCSSRARARVCATFSDYNIF